MTQCSPKPCSVCGVLVFDGSGRCDKHKVKAWSKRPNAPKRMTGRKLQRARQALFNDQPLCVHCLEQGCVRLATQRDHIVPVAEGGTDDPSNIQGLCDSCHKVKSEAEKQRGLRRG